MLDTDTKRRIDTARDILVGKVPDPKSQVEQITIALIYKFMDDMDAEAEELGGKRKFFAGDFARYGWARLMHAGLGGHETLNLYAEAIAKMPENPGVPRLFRDIFKNAYLPYRDPETLRAFLKVIDEFSYDHSERLGDAFEYLLSVLGSQGDAGQFRTPRHIIDFMVDVVDPKKNETVLDPACGTGGFLISSYKHILGANTDAEGNSTLTPDDRSRLARNFNGYDISPDMVRLSLVNMYLHGFTDPHIYEYDTLTSEERWNEYADVILANPPFMSPKGGIKPHKRFSVQSKRSEVLFVSYMAEHLSPGGRAGIIVPEGVIFQSQNAYTQLRKMLVEEFLVAVVSLPSGVFNPYSGVKTSILILDKSLANLTSTIGFFKIENDGFGLGAQRREIGKNDLPGACDEIAEYLRRLRTGESMEDFQPALGLVVPKAKIAASGDYNLSAERYREGGARASRFPLVPIGELCELIGGSTPSKQNASYWTNGTVKWISSKHIDTRGHITGYELISQAAIDGTSTKIAPKHSTIIITRVSVGKFALADDDYAVNQDLTALVSKDAERLSPEFIRVVAHLVAAVVARSAEGIGVRGVTRTFLSELPIPLPPLDVQNEIVAEIEGYQKVIDGARVVLDNYQPQIPTNPDWPTVELGRLCTQIQYGLSVPLNLDKTGVKTFRMNELVRGRCVDRGDMKYADISVEDSQKYRLARGDILFNRTNSFEHVGRTGIFDLDGAYCFASYLIRLTLDATKADPFFVNAFMNSDRFQQGIKQFASRAIGQSNINAKNLGAYRVPLPPLPTQRAIVAEIEEEQLLVVSNRQLIVRLEKKIQATLARVWGASDAATVTV